MEIVDPDSVVVFAVRKGNPKNIKTWDDLLRDDVEVITPNPFTSGGAQWNLMAAYGAQLQLGKTEDEAVEYLRKLLANVPVQDKSAREALQTFSGGKGDVLLAYENEAIFAQSKGEALDYVVPDQTILIENPLAVVKTSKHAKAAQAFVDYLRSTPAQRIFAKQGYRPVDATVAGEFASTFPKPSGLFTIDDLGGWLTAALDRRGWADGSVAGDVDELVAAVGAFRGPLMVVSPEVGFSVVAPNASGRRFADELGGLNQRLAQCCESVVLVVAGLPVRVKPQTMTEAGS